MTKLKDNQYLISIIFITFITGVAVGYWASNHKRNISENYLLDKVAEMDLRHAIMKSNVAKKESMIDSIKTYNDSIVKEKNIKYSNISRDYKNYKNEIKNNRIQITSIPAAQYVIDSILWANRIKN